MPLEDLTGNKYISDLNESWPLGSDYPDAGDDHIRGVKNVLVKTFPNVTGPVTLTQDELNNGIIPIGTRMLFYEASPPTGWTRVSLTNSRGVIAAPDGEDGGTLVSGDDPTRNEKVVSHNHTISGNTTTATATHSHTGNAASNGNHQHDIDGQGLVGGAGTDVGGSGKSTDVDGHTESTGSHSHTLTINSANASHNHPINFNSQAPNSATVGIWQPRHITMILCARET